MSDKTTPHPLLAELRRLSEAATKAPWQTFIYENTPPVLWDDRGETIAHVLYGGGRREPEIHANAMLVETARNSLSALLTLTESLWAEVQLWRKLWPDEIGEPTGMAIDLAQAATNAALAALPQPEKRT